MSNTPTAAQIAKTRRSGATWNEVRKQFGVRWPSGRFTAQLNEAGFDAAGLKLDGSGPKESKARTWAKKSRRGAAATKGEAS